MIIIPKPQKMSYFEGNYELKGALTVSKESYEKIHKDMKFFDISIETAKEAEENIFFYDDMTLNTEEYEIFINSSGITIISASEQGRFRALSTLKQILLQKEDGKLPFLKIHDFPDIPVRGIMLMAKSTCIYTIDTLHYIVDRMAEMKYNMLQLYFDTFVFEYESFKKHLEGKVYYTKEDIHDLDAYCKERHIELMANVETFGHNSELLACDEFKHLGITLENRAPFTINPLLDESFEVITRLLDDLLPHFSSPTVNIGMDETLGLGLAQTEEYCKAFGKDGLFLNFLTKVTGYIKEKHGKRSMIWGDMAAKLPRCLNDVPKDVIFVDWGYEPGHKFDENALLCKNAGLDFYVAPGTHTWNTITGRTDIMVQNIYFSAESARTHNAKGFLLTDWTISSTPSLSFLSYCFGAAFSWNSGYAETISEADNEDNCHFRNEVISSVLRYCDMFIYKSCTKSCAELVYRMGNYWFMEQPSTAAIWNGTLLGKYFYGKAHKNSPLKNEQLQRIKNYLSEIKEELKECSLEGKNAELILMELNTACDLAMFAAEVLKTESSRDENQIKEAALSLVERYNRLTKVHFCLPGTEPGIVSLIKMKASLN